MATQAKRRQVKSWICHDCGSRHSAKHDAEHHWNAKHGEGGILSIVFLVFEGWRYRYFNVWRARARWMETHFYAPMLRGEGVSLDHGWPQILARDYCEPRHHISLARAVGRRLRRNYIWILGIQALAYYGKIAVHPTPIANLGELIQRASVGPIPGELMLLGSILFNGAWITFAIVTLYLDRAKHGGKPIRVAMG